MAKEQRNQPRFEVELNSRSEGQGSVWNTCIRGFCQGGMLLEFRSGSGVHGGGSRSLRAGEKIEVVFSMLVNDRIHRHRISVKVAHVQEGRFGVQFLVQNNAVWSGLVAAHKSHKKKNSAGVSTIQPSPARIKVMMDGLMELVETTILHDGAPSCEYASELLLMASDRARENREKMEFQRAAQILIDKRGLILEGWADSMSRVISEAKKKAEKKADEIDYADMTLIDQRVFDEWVAAVGLGARLQADFADDLYALEQRLSVLAGTEIDKENNPLDPGSFIHCFTEAVESYSFSIAVKRLLLGGLGKQLKSFLGGVYEDANLLLIENGILPVISKKSLKNKATESPSQPVSESSSSSSLSGVQKKSSGETSAESEKSVGRSKGGVFRNLKNLFSPRKKTGDGKIDAHDLADTQEVIGALNKIAKGDSDRPLKDRVKEYLATTDGGAELPEDIEGAIEASDSLVAAFRQDEMIKHGIGDLVGKLDAPLAKTALEDPDFLSKENHPAAQFMQDLERLAVSMSGEGQIQSAQLKNVIDDTLTKLSQNEGAGTQAFADARDQLAPYVEKASRQFKVNMKRASATQEGEDKLRKAHIRVAKEINQLLQVKAVPRILCQLIQLGWGKLLVVVLLNKGDKTSDWSEYLDVIKVLSSWFVVGNNLPEAARVRSVIMVIKRGFAEAPSNPVKQEKLRGVLKKVLSEPSLFEQVCKDTMQFKFEVPEKAKIEDDITDPAAKKHLASFAQTIQGIAKGDWLVERQDSGISRPLNMVWKDEEGLRFAFVDGKGARALEAGLYQLAERLEKGELSVLEDGGLPLVQRAVQDVLKQTYEKLLHNTETDSLTGLINRRSFSKELDRAIKQSLSDHSQHVVLLVDLDNFKLINDICGQEGGDQLLIEISNILKTYLDDTVILGRVGDDEFGILIQMCSQEDGLRIAETQRKAIENYVFNWDGRHLGITASVGMVCLTETTESSSELIKDVDTACYLAKKDGRNLVKLYVSSDKDVVEHMDDVRAASMVEDAIQNGKLLLFVQLITPIFLDEGLVDHYEVLLRVLDENDFPGSPEGLIKAAEGYDRMRTIDRWVIGSLFNWIERNNQKLDDIGGFSINLSGQSVNDKNILEFILEKLNTTPYPIDRISFEITETAMIKNMDQAKEFMLAIKALGCEFYLDDFGSGLASYSYLKDLPIDCVKIDGSFVKNICIDENDFAMVKSITETAHFMKKRVIAEFVSDESIMIRLRELEVDYAQGYDVGKPFALTKLIA